MNIPPSLRILHLEDSLVDHELLEALLKRDDQIVLRDWLRVDSRLDFLNALELPWDVIISDFNLPDFSGLEALSLLRLRSLDIPFVLVSGEIGEDTAVEAMRLGASDYLLKNNLARLVPSILQVVEACQTRRARERADRELEESQRRLRELTQHLQTSIEGERAAIAREIHDDVGGTLTALKFDLAWMERHSTEPAIRARAVSALEAVSSAIGASQRIMHNLRPAILEQGLVAALQWLSKRFERRTGVTCTLRLPHYIPSLESTVALVAYRTAQEALTNITKHAQADCVNIDLVLAAGVLSLEIADNGRGLERSDLAKTRSFGIRGLHERAATVNGWVDLSSTPAGTTLILSIPLSEAQTTLEEDAAPHSHSDHHDPSGWVEWDISAPSKQSIDVSPDEGPEPS
jgi:signal transduction histidine kinase